MGTSFCFAFPSNFCFSSSANQNIKLLVCLQSQRVNRERMQVAQAKEIFSFCPRLFPLLSRNVNETPKGEKPCVVITPMLSRENAQQATKATQVQIASAVDLTLKKSFLFHLITFLKAPEVTPLNLCLLHIPWHKLQLYLNILNI